MTLEKYLWGDINFSGKMVKGEVPIQIYSLIWWIVDIRSVLKHRVVTKYNMSKAIWIRNQNIRQKVLSDAEVSTKKLEKSANLFTWKVVLNFGKVIWLKLLRRNFTKKYLEIQLIIFFYTTRLNRYLPQLLV